MKTRIKKIIIMAVALFFVSVGVSFAHDQKSNQHKPRGNAYGYYKKGYDYHPGWYNKHPKPKYNSPIDIVIGRFRKSAITTIALRHVKGTLSDLKVNEPDFKIAVVVKDRR